MGFAHGADTEATTIMTGSDDVLQGNVSHVDHSVLVSSFRQNLFIIREVSIVVSAGTVAEKSVCVCVCACV